MKKGKHSNVANAEESVRIFRLGAELQLSLNNNVSVGNISKLIVESLQRFVLDRKVAIRTPRTYNHYLRTLYMEQRPGKGRMILY